MCWNKCRNITKMFHKIIMKLVKKKKRKIKRRKVFTINLYKSYSNTFFRLWENCYICKVI